MPWIHRKRFEPPNSHCPFLLPWSVRRFDFVLFEERSKSIRHPWGDRCRPYSLIRSVQCFSIKRQRLCFHSPGRHHHRFHPCHISSVRVRMGWKHLNTWLLLCQLPTWLPVLNLLRHQGLVHRSRFDRPKRRTAFLQHRFRTVPWIPSSRLMSSGFKHQQGPTKLGWMTSK